MRVHPPNLGTFLFDQQNQILLAYNCATPTPAIFHDVAVGHTRLPDFLPQLDQAQQSAILNQNNNQSHEIASQIVNPDGVEQRVLLRFVPLAGPDPRLLLLVVLPLLDEDSQTVQRDALTGLPDRSELAAQHQRWQEAAGAATPDFAVLFMDLDQFKTINDHHGHLAGDQVLVELALRWQDCVRDGDLVARYGGDEFVVLLAGITSRSEVEPVTARLSGAASRPIVVGQDEFRVGVTIGIAISDNETSDLQELLMRADRDMYAIKQQDDPQNAGKSSHTK